MAGVCHHCGEPLPQSPVRADVEGTTRDFCCEGCAAAARWILDAHLDDYYRLRSAPGGRVDADAPALAVWDREELLAKFNELYSKLGDLSTKFREYVKDDEIDRRERQDLTDVGQNIHRTVEELLALTFQIYCRPGQR